MFTYPFCYTPSEEIVREAEAVISEIDADDSLRAAFGEGKMLGVMKVMDGSGEIKFIKAFSGNVGGKSIIEGFVPPVYDLLAPDGYYKKQESLISSEPDPDRKKAMSQGLQDWIFDQYRVRNALGECQTIKEIFARKGLVPPGGTGECAAPKMLQYAYENGLEPLSMGEFWYGASPDDEVRLQGRFYPSCSGKCGPLLEFMLRGLDVEPSPLTNHDFSEFGIIYEDDAVIVIDKPSGLICVPGKTGEVSLLERLEKQRHEKIYSCHRLDMDTSGLIVYAKTLSAKVELERQFSSRETVKEYIARLSSVPEAFDKPYLGVISLPLMLDYYDRPRQMVSFAEGKAAETSYELVHIHSSGEIDIMFRPHTGRTHQLRVHSAHSLGLGRPIKGDRLYGGSAYRRLCLHAFALEFTHPVSGERLRFDSGSDFAIFD